MVGSSPHVSGEGNRVVRIGTGQDRTLVGRIYRCVTVGERRELIMQGLFLKQFDFVVQSRDIRLQRNDTELKNHAYDSCLHTESRFCLDMHNEANSNLTEGTVKPIQRPDADQTRTQPNGRASLATVHDDKVLWCCWDTAEGSMASALSRSLSACSLLPRPCHVQPRAISVEDCFGSYSSDLSNPWLPPGGTRAGQALCLDCDKQVQSHSQGPPLPEISIHSL